MPLSVEHPRPKTPLAKNRLTPAVCAGGLTARRYSDQNSCLEKVRSPQPPAAALHTRWPRKRKHFSADIDRENEINEIHYPAAWYPSCLIEAPHLRLPPPDSSTGTSSSPVKCGMCTGGLIHLHNLSRGFSVDLASPQPSALWVSVVSVPEPSLLRAAFLQ